MVLHFDEVNLKYLLKSNTFQKKIYKVEFKKNLLSKIIFVKRFVFCFKDIKIKYTILHA